eukprot:722204-Karenia_brevis.AAC.1
MEDFTDHWNTPQHKENLRRALDIFNSNVGGKELHNTGGLLSMAHTMHITAVIPTVTYGPNA